MQGLATAAAAREAAKRKREAAKEDLQPAKRAISSLSKAISHEVQLPQGYDDSSSALDPALHGERFILHSSPAAE